MVCEIGAIADDLTGANDVAVQFAKHGLRTNVLVNARDAHGVALESDAIVIDTESRNVRCRVACARARVATRALTRIGVHRLYKKVDSTLRGHIGAELETIMDELSIKTCIFAPAFPANKRIVIGGYLLVNHVPLQNTEIARNELTQSRCSHVPTILESQTELEIGHIPLSIVMAGTERLKNEMICLKRNGVGIIVVDSTTRQNLRAVAEAAVASNTAALTSGSAGLAETLPEAFKLHFSLPTIVIAGSSRTTTIEQVTKAEEELNAAVVDLNLSKVLAKTDGSDEIQRVINDTMRLVETGRDVIITSCRGSMMLTVQQARALGLTGAEVKRRIVSALGESAREVLERAAIKGLILTGGETAIETLQRIEGAGVRVIDEISPGIPFGKIIGGRHNGLMIITKAGAFGDPDAISESISYLRRMRTGDGSRTNLREDPII